MDVHVFYFIGNNSKSKAETNSESTYHSEHYVDTNAKSSTYM